MITELKPTNLIAVEVPENAFNFDYENDKIFFDLPKSIFERSISLNGNCMDNFKILGTITKDKIGFDVTPYSYKYNTGFYREHKEKSFYYLLAVNGLYFENPEGKSYPYRLAKSDGTLQTLDWHRNKWKEFEDKLIAGKLLILEKL